jgi:hypothetical protein
MEKDYYFGTFSWLGYVPQEICETLIDRVSVPGDTIYDPFSGRGQILLAASGKSRKSIGTEISAFASAWSKVLLQKNHSGSDTARLISVKFDDQSYKTRHFLFGTICPVCGKEAYAQAILYRQGEPCELKTNCRSCKFAGMKEYTDFDAQKDKELENLELPIPGLDLSKKIKSMFSIKVLQALRILSLQVLKVKTEFLMPSLKIALAFTAAQCADLEQAIDSTGEFLFLNPFDFFPVNLLNLVRSAEMIEKTRGAEINIYRDSVFSALSKHNLKFDKIVCAPPVSGPVSDIPYVQITEAFMNLGLHSQEDKTVMSTEKDDFLNQGEITFPVNKSQENEFLKKCVWLFAELKKRSPLKKSINLIVPGNEEDYPCVLYKKAISLAALKEPEITFFNGKITGSADQFTRLKTAFSAIENRVWTLVSF